MVRFYFNIDNFNLNNNNNKKNVKPNKISSAGKYT